MTGAIKALQLIGLGWFIVLSILIPMLVGRWLDGQTRLSPLFMIGGAILGLMVAFVGTRRMIRDALSTGDKEHPH